jgi:pSer/pThr/pTyr-binding forkhead associated (FHA) protein
VCNSANAEGLRYCMTCGSVLQKPAAAAPAPPPAPVAHGPAASPAPAVPAAPIAPMPVVDLGHAATAAAESIRVCARCNGSCEGNAAFCKFCGASLAEAPVAQPVAAAQPSNGERAGPIPPHVPVSRAPTRPESPTARKLEAPADPFPVDVREAPTPPPPAPVAAVPAAAPSPSPAPGPVAPAAAAAKGRLVVIGKDGNEGPSYPLSDQVDIGRSEGNVVIHDDRYLSPRHARLVRRGERLILRDLGSVNGIFLRLARRSPKQSDDPSSVDHPLEDQDLILVGQQVIRFEVVRDADDGLGIAVEQDTLVFGTPALPRFARLSVRTVEGATRDVFYIRKNETVLGRESGDIVFTEDPFLSRRHCIFRRDGKRCTLTDLGSSNGTFVKLRGEAELKDGDQFRIGQQLFRVDLSRHA